MKKVLFTLSCILSVFTLMAADGDYSVTKVHADLLKNANAVKRFEEIRFEVESMSRSKLYKKYAITILNENGDRFSNFVEFYDNIREIKSIDGVLYDAGGKKIKSLKKSDVKDLSGTSDNNLADDSRYKLHNFYYKIYPYTVEYEVEIKVEGSYFVPHFIPQHAFNLAVQRSSLTIVCPEDFKISYKSFNYKMEPQRKTEKGKQVYAWEGSDYPAIVREPLAPSLDEIVPRVLISPVEFELEKVRGSNASWNDFGKFVYQLKADRDALPADIRQTVHSLTDGVKDPKEKVKRLYEFLQQNTRYISIQLGIGGLQPFDASYVATKRYGDCKALSNYMFALLKEAGIPSLYTVIRGGDDENDILAEFPGNQFNHVILCVPMAKDTMWLECTSATKAAGYMGGFTGDRYALLATDQGGKLVRTPRYGLKENLQTRKITATIDEAGTLRTDILSIYRAMQQDDLHELINGASNEQIKEYLKSVIRLPTYDVESFSYKEDKSMIPSVTESLKLVSTNYAQVSGKRLFITPNVLSRFSGRYIADDDRHFDMKISYAYTDIDTVEITIPDGYTPEAVPRDVNIENRFGKYQSSVKVSGNKIFFYRSMQQFSGRFPAKEYNELVKHFDVIYKADNAKVVMVKGN